MCGTSFADVERPGPDGTSGPQICRLVCDDVSQILGTPRDMIITTPTLVRSHSSHREETESHRRSDSQTIPTRPYGAASAPIITVLGGGERQR